MMKHGKIFTTEDAEYTEETEFYEFFVFEFLRVLCVLRGERILI